MGRYIRTPPFLGSDDLICIYKMKGRYYHRRRSRLTGERVKTDPRFGKTMEFAGLLAKASRVGSKIYAALPAQNKKHTLYRAITGEVMQWLKYHWKEQDIIEFLLEKHKAIPTYTQLTETVKEPRTRTTWNPADWEPLTHRRSIIAFVRNMCDQKSARRNRQYDRFLVVDASSKGDTT